MYRLLIAVFLGCLVAAGPALADQVKKPKPSVKRGLYSSSFDVELTSSTEGATIRYTLDGSKPSRSDGTRYTGPLRIETTTVLRMIAYKEGLSDSKVSTHTYIFPADVVNQPRSIDGYPRPEIRGQYDQRSWRLDYGMDPDVTESSEYRGEIVGALSAIPTLSLVLDKDDLWDMYDRGGSGRNRDFEEPASMELIYPDDPDDSFQEDAGLRPHSHVNIKRSLRLVFKEEYGPTRLRKPFFGKAPLNSENASESLDQIVLRGGNNRSIVGFMPENQKEAVYIRDEWMRSTQVAMSGYGSRGMFVHLYINGLYWGLYNPVERPDEAFAAEYFGGEPEEWYAANHGGDISGSDDRWDYLRDVLSYRDLDDDDDYEKVQEYLHIDSFIDYVLLYFYSGAGDWMEFGGTNNFYLINRNDPGGPLRFVTWDAESSWFDSGPPPMNREGRSNDGAWIKPQFLTGSEGSDESFLRDEYDIARIFRALMRNSDFRRRLADRTYKHLRTGGALNDQTSINRFETLADYIETAVIAEYARWGDGKTPDTNTGVSRFDRNDHWFDARDDVLDMMRGNGGKLIGLMRSTRMNGYRLYPSIDPPRYSQAGGSVPAGYGLVLTSRGGDGPMYYTLDGSDPIVNGIEYTEPIVISDVVTVKARTKNGSEWSAVVENTFFAEQDWTQLVISEMMYNPLPFGEEGQPEYVDADKFEFIELTNKGDVPINLSYAAFSDGIEMVFEPGTVIEANDTYVAAQNPEAFLQRYGFAAQGNYQGKLRNGGERVALSNGVGELVDEVTYSDLAPWPPEADGTGYSLELKDLNADNRSPAAWRASPAVGGSPGGLNVSNEPPNVSITSPELGAFIAPGSAVPVNIEAEDVDEDGRVLRVDVLLGNQLIERLSTAPYTFEIPGLAVGEYTLTAVAYDNGGARAETAPLTFTIGSEQPCALEPPALVINEINYLSPADLQSGDWAELYNPTGETVDLSGWVMKDETQTSAFTIPAGTTIAPGGYLVVAQDSTLFALAHPGVTSFVANYDFGLSSGDDIVRLYSPTGCEVDIVSYEENDPWPAEASGEGATLELINPTWDNNRPESWSPSARFGGTPGETNSFGWPRVEVVSPADGARVGQGTSVSVEAIVTTSSEVAGVTVRTNGVPIGKAQLNEKGNFYSFDWSDPEPGGYVIDLVVEDIQGRSTVSRPVQLTVLNSTALIAAGSTWRYNDTGDDLGTEWRTLEYDDSGWPTGAAQLGYGDEDEMTVISFGSDDRDKHPTAYFRHAFTIDDPSLYAALSLSILRDDGAVVYLNGTEILRSNMPDGEITFDTFAASVVKDEAEDTFVWRQIDLSTNPVLVAGTNVLAVEVHQRDAVSTDLSFDLALEGNPPGVYANVHAVLQGAFAGEAMRHELARYGWIPLQQPYAAAPWYYAGKEEVGELPDSTIVDWVLLQLRTDVGPETTVAERAAFLRSDGRIVNLDGESQVFFQGFDAGAYYLAIYHRNHLPIMTAAPVILRDSPTSPLYDFSQAMGRAYGSTEDPMVEVSPGIFALVAGDASGDNRLVRYSGPDNDRTAMLRLLNGNLADVRRGYYTGDLNLDGRVQYSGPANDRTVILRAAGGPAVVRSSQVPR